MSLIREQVMELRKYCVALEKYGGNFNSQCSCAIHNAIDTIEALSAKLSTVNMERSTAYYNDGWIPCKERLPEEEINPITKDFCEYQVTFQSEEVKDIRHYKFGKGHWWNGSEIMDEYVTAWRAPFPPYTE